MNYIYSNGMIGVDGERIASTHSKRSMSVSFSDYRDDFGYVDPDNEAMLNEIYSESEDNLKDIARCALDTMPDVACSAIAAALGLKLHTVIGLSNGQHNKAKRRGMSKGIELAEVTREELIENYRQQWSN